MIVVVRVWLLWRALREHAHDHGERPSLALAVAAGLVPCPLTFFIMSYAIRAASPVPAYCSPPASLREWS